MSHQELREKLIESLLCLTDDYLIDELGEEYEDFDNKVSQIITDSFDEYECENKVGDYEIKT